MTPLTNTLSLVADVCLLGLSVTLIFNMVYTHLRARWEETPIGRHLMKAQIALLLVVLFGSASLYFNEEKWSHQVIRILAIGILWKVMSERTIVFRTVQEKEENNDREPASY